MFVAFVGDTRREQSVPPPRSQRDREEIALLASTLIQPPPVANPDVPVAAAVVEQDPDGPPIVPTEDPPPADLGGWLGVAIRADLRAGRREATSLALGGGVDFWWGLRRSVPPLMGA